MVFASRARESGAEFAVTQRSAEGYDSAHHPEQKQNKTGMDLGQLKTEAGEYAGADNIGDNNPAGGNKADIPWRDRRCHGSRRVRRCDLIDNQWHDIQWTATGASLFVWLLLLSGEPEPRHSALLVVRSSGRTELLTIMNPIFSMERATQLAIFLSNRPGALVRVCDALAAAEVNIHALSTSDTIDHSVVRMVVSDPTKALMLLGEAGVLALENEVLMIELVNEPGTLAAVAAVLSKSDVNIEYAYMAATAKAGRGLMVLRPNDVDKAERALGQLKG